MRREPKPAATGLKALASASAAQLPAWKSLPLTNNPSNTEAQSGLRTEQPLIGLLIQANTGFRIHHNLE